MKQERFKNLLLGTICLILGVLFVLTALFSVQAAAGCFDTARRAREVYPWAVSQSGPGWEGAMYTLEDKQAQWFLVGILWGLRGLCELAAGIFLSHRGWKRWKAWKF